MKLIWLEKFSSNKCQINSLKVLLSLIIFLCSSVSFSEQLYRNLDLILKIPGVVSAELYESETFESLPKESVSGITPEVYQHTVDLLKNSNYEFFNITYLSGKYKVKGFVGVPRKIIVGQKMPAMIFNRGGNREFGRIIPGLLVRDSRIFANDGDFLFFATQYRGVAGGEGQDEFGGAEVQDVISLLTIASQFYLTDTKNIFLGGWSRGAAMTYLALKNQVKVNAAILVAGPTDFILSEQERPEMSHVYNELIPGIQNNREGVLKERSAVEWADLLNVPMLIVHGTNDVKVSYRHAEMITEKLKVYNKNFELLTYPKEGHGLLNVRDDLKIRVKEFLDKYKK